MKCRNLKNWHVSLVKYISLMEFCRSHFWPWKFFHLPVLLLHKYLPCAIIQGFGYATLTKQKRVSESTWYHMIDERIKRFTDYLKFSRLQNGETQEMSQRRCFPSRNGVWQVFWYPIGLLVTCSSVFSHVSFLYLWLFNKSKLGLYEINEIET